MNQLRRRTRALTALSILCLGSVLWLQGDADTVPPPAPATPRPLTGPTWGVEDPLTRLLPIDTYAGPLAGPLSLSGARNEVTDKQLILLAGPQSWTGVQIGFSDLHGPHKAVLAHTLLHWRRVGSVQTRKPYYQTRYVGPWPDPLLPPAPFDVPVRGRAAAWIDLHVPPGTAPGDYSGTITLTSRDAPPLRVPLTLHVWGFTLPRQNHIRTCFGVQGSGPFPLDLKALYDDMLAHRISPNNCIGDPKISSPTQADWSQFDRNMPRRLAQGVTGLTVNVPEGDPGRATLWQDHLKAKGWLGLAFTYVADEPVFDQLAALNDRLGQIKRSAPALDNLMTARGYPDQLTSVDIWCPQIISFSPDISRREQAGGRESWWYTAYSTQHPMINVWTDYPALDCRVWPWMTWKYNLDGMLYWSVCYWQGTPDPLTAASAFLGGDGPANGDGQLVYPGPGGTPIDSIRLEAIRDGMQDYEVFCLLEAGVRELQAAHKSPALVASARVLLNIDPAVLTSDTQYNPDPAALLAARDKMSRTVEQITAALGHDPRITARPRLHPEIPGLQYQAWKATQPVPR